MYLDNILYMQISVGLLDCTLRPRRFAADAICLGAATFAILPIWNREFTLRASLLWIQVCLSDKLTS